MTNAKTLLASCIRAAYPDYKLDQVKFITHKTAATTWALTKVKVTDKLEQATNALLSLLDTTEAEEASFRAVVTRMHNASIDAAEARTAAVEAARLQREAEEAELVARALAVRTQFVSDKLRAQGLGGAALEQAVQAVLAM